MDKQIGRQIRRIRNSWGMSQMELAAKVGVSFQQIQKYEKGVSRISVFRLGQIAAALGVRLTAFFEADGTPNVSGPTVQYRAGEMEIASPLSKEEIAILKLVRRIKNRQAVKGLLQQLQGVVRLEKG